MSTVLQESQPQIASSLDWKTYTSSQTDEALFEWRRLEDRLGDQGIACSATWTECWIRHYGDLVPFKILAAQANGQTRGIVLITEGVEQKDGPIPVHTTHVGTAGEPQIGSVCVEYNKLLIERGYEVLFFRGVVDTIQADPTWEQLRLDGFDELELAAWLAEFPDASVQSRDSKYFDLKQARDENKEILSLLGKSTRSNIRRRLKKYGDLECEWAEDLDQAASIFAEMIEMHQARWQAVGQPGSFATGRFRAFQEEAMVRLFAENRVVLFRVRHEGATVGCLYLLREGERLLDYISGFAPFDEKPSPGLISHYLCMERALQHGYAAYDFLVGDKQHKDNLSTHHNQLCWLTWKRPSWKAWSVEQLRRAKRLIGK